MNEQEKPIQGRRCIFCGGKPVTKEHLFSDWIDDVVARSDLGRLVRSHRAGESAAKFCEIPEAMLDKQIKVVCAICNNGWMSQIEANAKPVLTPLLRGTEAVLSPADQETIVIWTTLKSIIGEAGLHSEQRQIPQSAIELFYETKRPLPGWQVWCGHYCGTTWCLDARYSHRAARSRVNTFPEPGRVGVDYSLIQTSTFGIGRLFLHALSATLSLPAYPMFESQRLLRLHPGSGLDIQWQPFLWVSDEAATVITDFITTGENITVSTFSPNV